MIKKWWRVWAKALGEKSGKTDKEADFIAIIRTLIFIQLVITNWMKIRVLIVAIKSASLSDFPDFSPSAFAHTLHHFFIIAQSNWIANC